MFDDPPFTYACGTDGAKRIKGLLYTGREACLIYPIAERLRELTLEIDLAVEKSGGEGFGSANGQYLELFVNYNHETQSGTTGVGNRFLILGLHAAFHSFQNSRKD